MQQKGPLIIDRIEDNYIVVCEDYEGNRINIHRMNIEGKIEEGDVITLKDGRYIIEEEATFKRKKHIEDLVKGMWIEDEEQESE